ncbi:unnamed protein product, partial [Ectocarpus sp. 12 AP-2014]
HLDAHHHGKVRLGHLKARRRRHVVVAPLLQTDNNKIFNTRRVRAVVCKKRSRRNIYQGTETPCTKTPTPRSWARTEVCLPIGYQASILQFVDASSSCYLSSRSCCRSSHHSLPKGKPC